MKNKYGWLCAWGLLFTSCQGLMNQKIQGNGNVITENRKLNQVNVIYVGGNFDINLVPDADAGITVEADENLLPYIITETHGGRLRIENKENYSLSSRNPIKITVHVEHLNKLESAGNSNITGKGRFVGNEELELGLSGNGNIQLDIHNPRVNGSIAGSGSINIQGDTKDLKVSIAGTGSWKGEQLRAENVALNIAGTGDAYVYAEHTLKAKIAGTGNVFYRGKAEVQSDIAGTGGVKVLE